MNILVTGANGFIGAALTERLRGRANLVICQSRSVQPDAPGVKWIKHDLINDSWECLASYKIDIIFHLAGQTSTYCARENPIADLKANLISLLNLLEYMRSRVERPFVVLAGTATQVGMTDVLPINEDNHDHPITFYDISKLTAEHYLKQYIRDGLASGCVLRLANVYGGRQGLQKDRGILDKIYQQAAAGKRITIYGDGKYVRDYIHIHDVVSAFILAAERRVETEGGTYYIGSGQGVLLKDAFETVAKIGARSVGLEAEIVYSSMPPELSEIEQRNVVVDSKLFMRLTGWRPKYDFYSGIQETYSKKIKSNI